DEDNGVFAVIAVPMDCRSWFSRHVAGFKGLGGTVVSNDCVRSLQKIDNRRPLLVIMQANMTAGLNCENTKPQLTAVHARKFRAKFDHCSLAGRVSPVVLWSICSLRQGSAASK